MADKDKKQPARAQVIVTSGEISETIIGLDAGWRRVLELPRPARLSFDKFVRVEQ